MTLKQIEYFQKVCQTGNISTAADALFVSRSVVSRTILELEEEFETVLFTRSRNGVTLTESGHILARLFEVFMASCTAAKERIRSLSAQEQSQPLRIGVTPTNAYCVYKNYLERFQELCSDIRLSVTEHSAFDTEQLLLDGAIDAAFTPALPDKTFFEYFELYQNPIMLGAAENNPRIGSKAGIGDIIDLPLGFFNAPRPVEHILNASFEAVGCKPNVVLRTSDQMLLRELTLQGKIYPILPLDMMATWQGVRQVPIDFFQPSTNRVTWCRTLIPEPALAAFLDFMREQII